MNRLSISSSTLLVIILLTGAWLAFGQGSLTPPGSPAPMMKTLDQIEPRIPISEMGFVIERPGSYYLTQDLKGEGHGILVYASGVTLDLMGFSLIGDGGAGNFGVGVLGTTNGPIRNVVVRNGMINNFGIGVMCSIASDNVFEKLTVAENIQGIYLRGYMAECYGNTVADCKINNNTGTGIVLDGRTGKCNGHVFRNCTVRANGEEGILLDGTSGGQADGNTFTDCTLEDNGTVGMSLDGEGGQCNRNRVSNCTIAGSGTYGVELNGFSSGACAGNAFTDCAVQDNTDTGIRVTAGSGNRFKGCTISQSKSGSGVVMGTTSKGNSILDCTITGNKMNGVGLFAGGLCSENVAADCLITDNGGPGVKLEGTSGGATGGANGNRLTNCTISRNGSYGVWLVANGGRCDHNLLKECTITGNALDGVYLWETTGSVNGNLVTQCHLAGNRGNGIKISGGDGNRLEQNHIAYQTEPSGSTGGIAILAGSNNFVLRNTCVGHTNNFDLAGFTVYGPIVTSFGALSTNGAPAHPWANFSR